MGVVVSESGRRDLRRRLLRGIRDAFGGSPGRTLSGQPVPEFLAGPAPGDPWGDFQHRGGRAICDRWARGERPQILPGRELYYRQLCEPYLGEDMPGEPESGPPFPGGQCAGLNYRPSGTFTRQCGTGGTGTWVAENIGPGPISGVVKGVLGSPTLYGIIYGNGAVTRLRSGSSVVIELAPGQSCVGATTPERIAVPGSVVITSSGPQGHSDACGDPPEEFDPGPRNPTPDPNPGPVGGPTGFPFPDIDVTINPDGTINVDFGDGEPPEVIDPGEPGGDTGVDEPPSPGEPGGVEDTGVGGEAEGAADEGQELVGVLVRVVSAPTNPNVFDNVSTTVYRGIGYVAMGYENRLGVDTSAAVVISPQFFHAQQRGLTHWRVRANVGFRLETTPYYREIEV